MVRAGVLDRNPCERRDRSSAAAGNAARGIVESDQTDDFASAPRYNAILRFASSLLHGIQPRSSNDPWETTMTTTIAPPDLSARSLGFEVERSMRASAAGALSCMDGTIRSLVRSARDGSDERRSEFRFFL